MAVAYDNIVLRLIHRVRAEPLAEVAERQTQRTQNPPPLKACGFKSHLRHQ